MKVHTVRFRSISPTSGGAVRVDFQDVNSSRAVQFSAGQHALWQIPGGGVHPFTIASAPQEDVVSLGTSLASGSRLKKAIGGLADGDKARLLAPIGKFTVDGTDGPLIMLAQGLGVTPFRSILRSFDLTGERRDTALLQVGADHAFRADTEPLATTSAFVDAREPFIDLLDSLIADHPAATFMVSGSPAFVSSTVARLRDSGVSSAQLRTDKFWGYRAHSSAAVAA